MVDAALFTSARGDWATPRDLMARIIERWGPFDLDPAASAENAKAPAFYDGGENGDGLTDPWFGNVFLNPPYGRRIGDWTRKAVEEHDEHHTLGATLLLPARPDTQWWKALWERADQVAFLVGRVTFVGAPSPAPFPSAVVHLGESAVADPYVSLWEDWKNG
jgi:phage N-6-adenine-methyltransferase